MPSENTDVQLGGAPGLISESRCVVFGGVQDCLYTVKMSAPVVPVS